MNKVILIGNLTKDPDSGRAGDSTYTRFTLAVNRPGAHGENSADFLPVVTWNKVAEVCKTYLSKGRKVAVEGAVRTRSYTEKDGSRKSVTEILAERVELLSEKGKDDQLERGREEDLPF